MKFLRVFVQAARVLLWSGGMSFLLIVSFCFACNAMREECGCILEFGYSKLCDIVLTPLVMMALSWVVGLVGGRQVLAPSVTLVSVATWLSTLSIISDLFQYDLLRTVEEGGLGHCDTCSICLGFVFVWSAIILDIWLAYRRLKPEGRRVQFIRLLLWVVSMIGIAAVIGMFAIGSCGEGLENLMKDTLPVTLMALPACLLAGWVGGRHLIIPSGMLALVSCMLLAVLK